MPIRQNGQKRNYVPIFMERRLPGVIRKARDRALTSTTCAFSVNLTNSGVGGDPALRARLSKASVLQRRLRHFNFIASCAQERANWRPDPI